MLEKALPYQSFHVRAAQEMVGALLQVDRALVGHDFAAVREDADFDAHFLGGLARGQGGWRRKGEGGKGKEDE
jgi:hypothetical protein